jgi:benzil reductase ((S)-benzoin forming)
MRLVIITGTSSGLGKAIAFEVLSETRDAVLSISRSYNSALKTEFSERYFWIEANLEEMLTSEFCNQLRVCIEPFEELVYINNASIVEPIRKIGQFSEIEMQRSININVFNPVFMMNELIKYYSEKLKILVQIDSGAGRMDIENWSLYGAGKAYLFRFLSIVRAENFNIKVDIIDPGMLDTGMQEQIRKARFPLNQHFVSAYAEKKLISPDGSAKNILNRIFEK